MSKKQKPETHNILIGAILGGAAIGLGGIAYLSVESTFLGAFLFSIGLFAVCIFDLDLYTGQISYIFQWRSPKILITLGGNLIGAWCMGWLLRLSHITKAIIRAEALAQTKADKSLLSLFILAALCNVCIYIAVRTYHSHKESTYKCLAIILGVMVFILCGFEHSIADMFYFTIAGWTWREVLCLLVIIGGNAVGGVVTHNLKKVAIQ